MTDSLPDFDLITDSLHSLEASSDAAECHGILCGMLCTVESLNPDDWLNVIISGRNNQDLSRQQPLDHLFQETRRQFDSSDFNFHLLLPDDEAGLAARVEALGHWCQGFLTGLSAGGIQQVDKLPGELPEIYKDLLEIAQAERYELAGDEEDESAYAELVEYVRMGVLLFREEFRRQFAAANTDNNPRQLH
jgi:yecA family protein